MLLTSTLFNNIETNLANPSVTPLGIFFVSCNTDNYGIPTTLLMTYNQIKQQILSGKLGFVQIKNSTNIKNEIIIQIDTVSNNYTVRLSKYAFYSDTADGTLTYTQVV